MLDSTGPSRVPTRAALLIMGSPRSGTTFLAQMVNRFLDVHICRDNGTMLRFYGIRSHYEPLGEDSNLRRLIAHLYADYFFRQRLLKRGLTLTEEELFAMVRWRTYAGVVEAVFSAVASTHGKGSWGYKRASFARVEGHHVDDLFPEARLVHVIRDARDVVLSMRTSTDLLLERSWHFGAADWVSHLRTGRRIGQCLGTGRYLEIRYEQFMAAPEAVLAEVLAFAGAGADAEERVARIQTDVRALVKSGNTEKWRRLVPDRAIRTIERVAGPLLEELGYPLVNPEVAGARVSAPEMAWLHLDRVSRNLFQTRLAAMARYRLEVLRAHHRAKYSRVVGDGPPKDRQG